MYRYIALESIDIFIIHRLIAPISERMKIRHCTLHDHKNQTNSYDFLRIKRVHALDSSVSFKPIFVDFTRVIDMLSLLHYYCHGRAINLFLFCTE